MNQLVVDQEKCAGCGKCRERCGIKEVISLNGNGKASFKEDRSECIECYHCMMICPNEAIRPNGDSNIMVAKVTGDTFPVLTRRSCRVYKDQKPGKEVLNDLINEANLAPRAYIDFTERKFLVITGQKLAELRIFLLKKMAGHAALFRLLYKMPFLLKETKVNLKHLARCFTMSVAANQEREQLFQGAPAVVLVCGPAKRAVSRVNSEYALMQLMILAEEKGLGTCVSGYVGGYANHISKFLGLPKDEEVFCGAMIGYPAAGFKRYIVRNDTVINWL